MARRVTTGADRLFRTASVIDFNAAYTIVFQAKPYDVTGNFVMASVNTDSFFANFDVCRIRFGALGLSINGSDVTGGSISTGSFFKGAMRRNSASSIDALLNSTVVANDTTNVSGRSASSRIDIGGFTTTNIDTGNATFCAVKIWTAALSDGEIALEYDTVCPVRTANLWEWYAINSDGTRDTGFANGRDLSESGTLSDESPPGGLNTSTTCGGAATAYMTTNTGYWGTP